MKKIMLVAILIVFGFSQAHAQGISFGGKFGANFVNLRGDVENNAFEVSFHAGALVEWMFIKKLGVQAELLYSMQGTKQEGDNKLQLNYITLPIIVKFYFTDALSVHAGPQVGYLISAKYGNEDNKEDVSYLFSDIDYGIVAGVGYEFNMGVFFSARYYLGRYDIQEKYGLTGIDFDPEVYNRVIQLSLGYKF